MAVFSETLLSSALLSGLPGLLVLSSRGSGLVKRAPAGAPAMPRPAGHVPETSRRLVRAAMSEARAACRSDAL